MYSIGHSTRSVKEFIAMLNAYGIKMVVDVRTVPKSRHNPQFNRDELEKSLEESGIRYIHMKGLGGLRHAKKNSPNPAWRNASFRGFADYMQTQEFDTALGELISLSSDKITAVMCAESVPWRCHRSLIADALFIRGIMVKHIYSEKSIKEHVLTSFAKFENDRIWYPME